MANTIYMVGETYLAYKEKTMQSVNIKNSTDVARFLKTIWYPDLPIIERFLLLNINRANNIISYHWISQGGIAGTIIDIRIILKSAVESLSSSIILAHNHPSGNTSPSVADTTITSKIKTAIGYFDIELFDHIILTQDNHYSFADEGIL